jgi:hypothetical protein
VASKGSLDRLKYYVNLLIWNNLSIPDASNEVHLGVVSAKHQGTAAGAAVVDG